VFKIDLNGGDVVSDSKTSMMLRVSLCIVASIILMLR
jgi:hypothetical protein